MNDLTKSAFCDSIRDTLRAAGFKPAVSGPAKSGLHRVWREGYYLGTFLTPSLQWSFTTDYINANRRDLSDEYRVKEKGMFDALQRAGFHAYFSGTLLYVCCADQKHDHHAECRKAANA